MNVRVNGDVRLGGVFADTLGTAIIAPGVKP